MTLNEFGIEVWVLTTENKPTLTTKFLDRSEEPHQVYVNKDWSLPPRIRTHPRVQRDLRQKKLQKYYGINAYRCFRGHQMILNRVQDQYALVFEDDAWPNHPSWRKFVVAAIPLLQRFQVISFHGRAIIPKNPFMHKDRQYVQPSMDPGRGFVRCFGSLCYLVRRRVARLIAGRAWERLPMDLLLCNEYRFAVMEPSLFNHDRRHGSLIDRTVKGK